MAGYGSVAQTVWHPVFMAFGMNVSQQPVGLGWVKHSHHCICHSNKVAFEFCLTRCISVMMSTLIIVVDSVVEQHCKICWTNWLCKAVVLGRWCSKYIQRDSGYTYAWWAFVLLFSALTTTTTTIFIRQNVQKPERATAHHSWLLTKETQIKHKH